MRQLRGNVNDILDTGDEKMVSRGVDEVLCGGR